MLSIQTVMLIVGLMAITLQASGKTNIVVMLGDSTTLCGPNKPGAKILLITSTPFNDARHPWNSRFQAKGGLDKYMDTKICAAARSLAKQYNLPLCDLHEHFVAQFKKDPALIDKLLFGDGVHLTDQGNEVAATFVAPYIVRLLGKPDNIKMS